MLLRFDGMRINRTFPRMELIQSLFYTVRGSLAIPCPASQGRSLRGTAPRGGRRWLSDIREAINTINNQPCKRASDGENFCPPRGAARSFPPVCSGLVKRNGV